MNYAVHYDRLIERARGRVIDGYRERHHVVPKCMGGGNEAANIVELTGEEHYVAHQLLVKIHPDVRGLVTAAVRMAKQCIGNKAYAWLRKKQADERRGKRPDFSPQAMERMRTASIGNKRALGYRHSEEARKRIAAASEGNKYASAGLRMRTDPTSSGREPTNYKNLAGMVFGHLTVLTETVQQKGKARWICRCHCGKEVAVTGSALQQGQYSCGCTRYAKRKHGMSNSKEYRVWSDIIQRCSNPTVRAYDNYGARGISVCERWRGSFVEFLSDVGMAKDGEYLGRMDVNGDYEPMNCRWMPKNKQGKNKRRVQLINGKTLPEIAKETGIKYATLVYRLKHNWSVDRAIGVLP